MKITTLIDQPLSDGITIDKKTINIILIVIAVLLTAFIITKLVKKNNQL